MGFAEDKLYEFIEGKLAEFSYNIKVENILVYLTCLTPGDKDEILSKVNMKGNWLAVRLLLDTLRRRQGWVCQFIDALERERSELASAVRAKYEELQNPSSSRRHIPSVQPSLNSVSPSSSHPVVPSASPLPPSTAAYPISQLPPSASQSSELQPNSTCSPPPSYSSLQCMPSASMHPKDNIPLNPMCLELPRLPQNDECNLQSQLSASAPRESPTTAVAPSQSYVPSASVQIETPTTSVVPPQSCDSTLIAGSTISPDMPASSHSVHFPPSEPEVTNSSTQASCVPAAAPVRDTVLHAFEPSPRFSPSALLQAPTSQGSSYVEEVGSKNSYTKAPVQETVISNPEHTFPKEQRETREESMTSYVKAPIQEKIILNPDQSFPTERRDTRTQTKQENTDTQLHAGQQNQVPAEQGQQPVYKKTTVANPFQTAAANVSSNEQPREMHSSQVNHPLYEDFSKPGILMSAVSETATVDHHHVADQTREGYSGNSNNLQISSSLNGSDIERDLEDDPLQISTSIYDGTTCRVPEEDDYMSSEPVSTAAVPGVNNLGNIIAPLHLQQRDDTSKNVTHLANVSKSGRCTQLNTDGHPNSYMAEYSAQFPEAKKNSQESISVPELMQSSAPNGMPAECSDVEVHSFHITEQPDALLLAGSERLSSADGVGYLDRNCFPSGFAPSESTNSLDPEDYASPLLSEKTLAQDPTESINNVEAQPLDIYVFSVIALVTISAFLMWRYMRK